jgi:copper chaperone
LFYNLNDYLHDKKGIKVINLTVSGMTCGGCIKAVTRAIQAQDAQAEVQVDLATQQIALKTSLSVEQARELIADAGFPVLS